jgi:subtilisin family serine protease
MSTLDGRLKSLLTRNRPPSRAGATLRRARKLPERVNITVKFTGSLEDLAAVGFASRTVLTHPTDTSIIATGSIPTVQLEALAAIEHVRRIEGARAQQPDLDESVPEINAGPGHAPASEFTGSGVVLGVIDSGFDYRHNVFRKADGTTRILALWDQRLDAAEEGGDPPEGFDFGVEFDDDMINEALEAADALGPAEAFNHVNSRDRRGHGTRVASIAAGNGSQAGNCEGAFTFVGVAPEADLILVCREIQSGAIGESDNTEDALRYIFQHPRVAGRPVVINLSQGDNLGPHDGTSLLEQAIDRFLIFPRRAIIKSAGNEADARRHARGTIPPDETLRLVFDVEAEDSADRTLELWYPGNRSLMARVRVPVVPVVSTNEIGPDDDDLLEVGDADDPTTVILTSLDTNDDNGDRSITVELVSPEDGAPLPSGEWTFELRNPGSTPVPFDCWIERGSEAPTFVEPEAGEEDPVTIETTVNTPGTAHSVITVAAYSPEGSALGIVRATSGRGPTRANSFEPIVRLKPEIAAPGEAITAARANKEGSGCSDCCVDFYISKNGTSYSTPHVAGAVALMFEKNPDLTIAQIREALFKNAAEPDGDPSPPLPNNDWGYGRLDVSAVLDRVEEPPDRRARRRGGGPRPVGGRSTAAGSSPSRTADRARRGGTLSNAPAFRALRQRALATPMGQLYASLVSRYFSEIRGLIRSQRRLAAVWRRSGGPQIIRELARRVVDADRPFPIAIEGVPIGEGVQRFVDVLERYASIELRRDIQRYAALMLVIEGRSLNQILTPAALSESSRAGVV